MSEVNRNEYQPDMVLPPGETLSEMLLERNMSQAQLAERMGRPLKTVNEIVKGKTAIKPDTAIQLERVFGVNADFWNQLEINYQSFLARLKENQRLSGQEAWLEKNKFPIKKMIERKWIPDIGKNILLQIREILNFFSVASPNEWEKIWSNRELAFRRSDKSETQLGPTTVWLRQGEIEANNIACLDFDPMLCKASFFEKLRALTVESDPRIFVPEIQKICATAGIAVVFLPAFKGTPVSGVSLWLTSKKAMVLLSLRYKSDDHLWFTLFHEIAHILLHNKKEMFVEFSKTPTKSKEETDADNFAAETLIPKDKLNTWVSANPKISEWSVLSLAKTLGIAPGIVVGRLQHIGKITHSYLNGLKKSYRWSEET